MEDSRWRGWNEALAAMLARGGKASAAELVESLRHLAGIDAAAVLAYRAGEPPAILHSELDKSWRRDTLTDYRSGAYLLDPFYLLQRKGGLSGVYRLSDITSPDFRRGTYYLNYYRAAKVGDEVNLFATDAEGTTIALILERSRQSARFSAAELSRLEVAHPVIAILLRRLAGEAHFDAGGRTLHSRLERALALFGTSLLTRREAEILQLLMRGYATSAIAERLGISGGTVKVHRRHIYDKLDIRSQAELLPLFINSLSYAEAKGGDALALYALPLARR